MQLSEHIFRYKEIRCKTDAKNKYYYALSNDQPIRRGEFRLNGLVFNQVK